MVPAPVVVQVLAYAPYPATNHVPALDDDDRWHWLPLSIKRGETWLGFDRQTRYEPCAYVAERLSIRPHLGADHTLVPVPGSTAGTQRVWPARTFADAIAQQTGATVTTMLQRTTSVQKASKANMEGKSRPTVAEHEASLLGPFPPVRTSLVILVDDTITRGTQLVGAINVLRRSGYAGPALAICAGYTLPNGEASRDTNRELRIEWVQGQNYPRIV